MSAKLWGGRFAKPTHDLVDHYTASIQFDVVLLMDDIQGSLAHAAMLAECGLLSAAEHQEIKQGLFQLKKNYAEGALDLKVSDEDIHMNLERALFKLIGETAKKLHTARSRNDQVALDLHLYLRRQIVVIVALLLQLQKTFLALARRHIGVIMPGYTHLQRAQPIYFSSHCLAYVSMFGRDIGRLQDLWQRANISPLGACALAGSSLPVDRAFTASLLGFDTVYTNTLDAVGDRDFIIEFLSAASLIMLHVSRLSEELILWSSQEFNFISFDDAFSTGSSMMPQKKNPDVAELARGKTGRVYGALMSVLTLQKSLPLAYNKDMQEDKEPLFDTVKTLNSTLRLYSPMLSSLSLNTEAMRRAVDFGYLNATALAEYLVKAGLPFRRAHEVVGQLVAHCIDKRCCLEELSLSVFQQFCAGIEASVYEALNLDHIVVMQDHGNPQKKSYLQQEMQAAEQVFASTESWLAVKHTLFDEVQQRLVGMQ